MKRRLSILAAIVGLLAIIFLCRQAGEVLMCSIESTEETDGTTKSVVNDCVVIDPGHGGVDAGKVAANGMEEKDINLKIALNIKRQLEKKGIEVVMTRIEDKRLGSTQAEDLKERVRVINDNQPAIAVSIHQNSYHEESVHGPQMFYYTDSEKGKNAAMILQQFWEKIEPDNMRQAKANSTYYILKNTQVPTVIAECGFLSNSSDAEKLSDVQYQQKIAEVLSAGIIEWCSAE